MPVILVFTKSDVVVSKVLVDTASGDARQHKRAKVRAHAIYEDCCRRLFHEDVPAEIVSGTRSLSLCTLRRVTLADHISWSLKKPRKREKIGNERSC